MAGRNSLLSNILRILVQEWGHQEVDAALADLISNTKTSVDDYKVKRHRVSTRPLAIEQVARAQLPEAQEGTLRELATRFDRKQFLPTVSDVREFLLLMGENPGMMKDRSEAFRRLLRAISGLPPEQLERLAASTHHSGPSQLGPLSDAISSAAASLPRNREPNDS